MPRGKQGFGEQEDLTAVAFKDQKTGDNRQSIGDNNQPNITIFQHNTSLSPKKEKPQSNQNQTTDNSGKIIGVGNTPINHNLILSAKDNDQRKNNPDINKLTVNKETNSAQSLGLTNNVEITPA
ncbi:MAG: hypothetical protein COY68_00485 [Candidatus Levybacteria bacterium CG_4_10_14_0_8_um_filter_35_23]|nr:MAG: hypothetical protein COY68_00485 [Candidatus Levybacteria bacterium CG_4_10_14_0_8_um_filter_35_23]